MTARLAHRLGAATAVALFLGFAWRGLFYYFDTDDVMNLRRAWTIPVLDLVRDCFSFGRETYRPLGLLIYRAIFAAAGFHAFAFHLTCFALLLFNLFLLYRLALALTSSRETALFALLLGAFHARLDNLYINAGDLYDISCYTLYLSALLVYLRSGIGLPTLGLLLLQLLALDAKEMAASLPVILFCYEIIYRGVAWTSWKRWVNPALLTLLTAVFMVPKLLYGSPLSAGYHPTYTLGMLVQNGRHYMGELFYQFKPLPLPVFVLVLALLWLTAILLRSKPLLFCCCFITITPLPVCFVEQRSLNVWYIPVTGWAIYIAVLLNRALQPLAAPARAAGFVALAGLLAAAHLSQRPYTFDPDSGKNQQIRVFRDQFLALCPRVTASTRILFLNDGFDSTEWTPSSFLQLYFGIPELNIQRVKMAEQFALTPGTTYDYVLDYRDKRLVLTSRRLPQDDPVVR